MMILGGMQAALGLALLINGVATATAIRGDGDSSTRAAPHQVRLTLESEYSLE